jgi:hypothetical protein
METAPHPPHSPDLTPSGFYLFGYVKGCLVSLRFESADDLLEAILERIQKAILQEVFLEWMDWLRKEITTDGEYTN